MTCVKDIKDINKGKMSGKLRLRYLFCRFIAGSVLCKKRRYSCVYDTLQVVNVRYKDTHSEIHCHPLCPSLTHFTILSSLPPPLPFSFHRTYSTSSSLSINLLPNLLLPPSYPMNSSPSLIHSPTLFSLSYPLSTSIPISISSLLPPSPIHLLSLPYPLTPPFTSLSPSTILSPPPILSLPSLPPLSTHLPTFHLLLLATPQHTVVNRS